MRKTLLCTVCASCLMLMGCGTTAMTSSNNNGSGILGGILNVLSNGNTIADAISSVIGASTLSAEQLVGTWDYNGPGCAFTSENTLAKAGGEVVAADIKQKLLPTYNKLGISSSNTSVTFNKDNTFSAKILGRNISGQYTYDESTRRINMKSLLLNINCYAKRNSQGIALLFEAKKLLTLFQTFAAMSGDTTLGSVGDISKNYDGVRLGFDMR